MTKMIDTSENEYRVWKNPYGIRINAACFSCKWTETYDMRGNRTCGLEHDCTVHKRTDVCRAWEPQHQYAVIGSNINSHGSKAVPGKIKKAMYLHWLADNHSMIKGSMHDVRRMFLDKYPEVGIYYGRPTDEY